MGDTARELPDGLHALGLSQVFFVLTKCYFRLFSCELVLSPVALGLSQVRRKGGDLDRELTELVLTLERQ